MLLGTQQISVGLRLYLKDEFSAPAGRIKTNLKALRDETRLYQDSLRAARNMMGGLAAAGSAAVYGLASAYQQGAKFDFMMKGVAAASGATAEEYKKMMDYANKMGSTSLYLPNDYASTMRELALAGLDAKEVMSSITPITKLAGGAMEDLKISSEIATNAMYQFGYDKSKIENWNYVADILAQGAVKSQISLRDLGESIKYAGATSVDLGQTLPDITAMIMTLGNAGIKGSMAGTAIENMFRYMSLGLGQYAKTGRAEVWEKIGLNPKAMVTAEGNLRPFPEIMSQLYTALEKFGDVDRQNILYEIFNVRGKRGASKLLMDGLKEYKKHIIELRSSKGVAGAMYDKMLESPEGAIIRLKGAFQSLLNEFTQVMAPIITPILLGISKIFQVFKKMMESPFIKWVVILGTGLLVVGTAIAAAGFTISGLSMLLMTSTTSFATMAGAIRVATLRLLEYVGASRMAAGLSMTNMGANVMGGAMGTAGTVGAISQIGRGARGGFYTLTKGGNRRYLKLTPDQINAAGLGDMKKGTAPLIGSQSVKGAGSRFAMGGLGKVFGGLGIATGAYQAATADNGWDVAGGIGTAVGGGLMFVPGLQPVGMAVMALSTVIPMLANAINRNSNETARNTDSTGENTDRLKLSFMGNVDNAGHSQYIRRLYKYNVGENNAVDFSLQRQLLSYLKNPGAFGGKPFMDYSVPNELNIYVDGKLDQHLIMNAVNKNINTSLQFQ